MARIYVCDDNADVRHVVIYSLTDDDHEIVMLKDGEAALEALLADAPDLLILDLMMPGADGYEILSQIESWGIRDQMRTIVLTARASDEVRRRALDLGADEFITKPFDPEVLAQAVAHLLSLSPADLRARRARSSQEELSLSESDGSPSFER
jgi:DNA-binding response OmpR family regulator